MADVSGKFFSAKKVRTGVSPSSPGIEVGETLPPVNPPGGALNSVGLTMPSAFTVSNSPLTSNGSLDVTGAGTVAQYIRGDGSLADFPESSGGGSSVSYYLNGSVAQGTIGGIAYKELSKVPILGAGTDFTINADGYIASFITDAGDPNLLEIPGGNWNFETYFSASSGGGSPTFYVELYKVNAGGTATLIASSSSAPELIAFGTNLTPYFSSLAVPTTTLALTDRLAVRYYVTHSGRTITMHTEGPHLCQIITTFTTGLTALNGLTAQVQNFSVGTTGTDFNIASAVSTHTFNLPTASATNRGALSAADWALFTQAYNDKINSAAVTGTTTKTLTLTQQDGGTITASWSDLNTDAVLSVFGRTGNVIAVSGDYTTAQVTESGNLYYTDARSRAALSFAAGSGAYNSGTGVITIPTNNNQITNGAGYITSAALGGYVPTSRTITINGTTQDLSANRTFNVGTVTSVTASTPLFSSGGNTPNITIQQASGSQSGFLSSTDWTTFNNKQNALTNPVTGTGTTNYLPKFTGSTTIGNSNIINDASGNFGLGVTPSAWGNTYKVLQFPGGYVGSDSTLVNGLGQNFVWSGSASLYVNNGFACDYYQYLGQHVWRTAPSGTAGNAITFTQAMTLTSGGNLLVGTTTDNGARLQVSGRTQISGGSLDSSTLTDLCIVSALTTGRSGTYQSNSLASISTRGDASSIELIAGTTSGFYTGISATANNASTFTGVLRLLTAGLERMRITNGGNVLIGTTTDNGRLRVKASGNDTYAIAFERSNATTIIGGFYQNSGSSGELFLNASNGSQNVKISSTGDSYWAAPSAKFSIGTSINTTDLLRVAGNTFTNTIRTFNPENDNRSVEWRLGSASIATITPNRRLRVSVDGIEYYIAAVEI
jgi:hypothetical protein